MIESLRDILVVSDIDNTLLTPSAGIPSVNKATIELFCALGGRFTVATGRTVESVRQRLGDLTLSAPAITVGGGVICDFSTGERIKNEILPRAVAYRALEDVYTRFPMLGIEVMGADDHLYIVRSNEFVQQHLLQEEMSCLLIPLDEIYCEWNKVLFAGDPDTLKKVKTFVEARYYPGVYFIETNAMYYEIMPEGVSKGQALKDLCRYLKIPVENTIAIGDYFNDIELLQAAGRSVAVQNAPGEVQLVADEITSACLDGGVAEILYRLIRQYS
ncbi:HAD-IIB family hydrolase [uncultured Ruthenibacterium sp.]|uniref:HAD-IIB family hydrolase n=1 Tax=uncultured Ruthenibacterium sp. TaxID=1905347 RepID=UPI00349EB438